MIRKTGQFHRRAATAEIHPKNAHAAGVELLGHPLHVNALVAAPQSVQQQRDGVPRSPVWRAIVVQNGGVAVVEGEPVMNGAIRRERSRKKDAGQGLGVTVPK